MAQSIQLRNDTAANWTTYNPILMLGELGFETDTGFYKLGTGVTAWNTLSYYALKEMDTANNILMTAITAPAPPVAGKMNVYSKAIGGRMFLKVMAPSGRDFPLQPSFFQNNIMMIQTGTTNVITSMGNTTINAGVISHPIPTEKYGWMADFQTAATVNTPAGTGFRDLIFTRGTLAGGANGFFFNSRLGFPNSNYDETGAATGSRIFVGLTNLALTVQVGSDNPAGHNVGFYRRHVNGAAKDVNWQFITKNNVSPNIQDTGCLFVADHAYDFYIFCKLLGTEIFWRIDDMTSGTSFEGSTSTQLPDTNIWLRPGFQIQTINAVARNIRMQRVYIESDR